MSYSFNGSGKNRREVIANLRVAAELSAARFPADQPGIPIDTLMAAAETLVIGMPEDTVRSAACSGHLNSDGSGNIKISIN